MSLFYLNEHTSCYNYSNFIEEGFATINLIKE